MNELIKDHIRLLLIPALTDRLIPNSINSTINHPVVSLDDLLHWITIPKIDRKSTHLLRRIQPLLHLINDKYPARATNDARIRSHQTDRTGAEDSHTFTGLEAGQHETMPAGGEDVGQKRKVGLVLRARWQLERVEVGVRHAEVLGLAALVRTHGDVAVGTTSEAWVDS